MLGVFVKTPAMHVVAVLASVSFDFIVLDALFIAPADLAVSYGLEDWY